MIGDYSSITMQKGSMTLCFDIVIPTDKGAIYCVYLKRGCKMANVATRGMGDPIVTTMTIKQAHKQFGHNNKEATCAMAKHLLIKITQGCMMPCEACTLAKAKQKNVPKINKTQVHATKFGERIYSDLLTVRQANSGQSVTKPNWHKMIDKATRLKFSAFYDSKNGMVEPTCEIVHCWKQG
jgi:hypothetical protein